MVYFSVLSSFGAAVAQKGEDPDRRLKAKRVPPRGQRRWVIWGEREGSGRGQRGWGINAQRCLWTKIGHCNTVLSIFEIY